jgi:histidinol-phosphate/aromatic aminotransferase/cobyric acid decarboxylase-like protein
MDNIPVWNMNSMAEHFVEILLKHRNSINKSFEDTKRDRTAFAQLLKCVDIIKRVLPSGANFLTCELSISNEELKALQELLLTKHKIYIKNATEKFDDGKTYIRLAVRTPTENRQLASTLQKQVVEALA